MRQNHRIFALILSLVVSACAPQGAVPSTTTTAAPRSDTFPAAGACDAQTARSVDEWLGGWREWHGDGAQLPPLPNSTPNYVVREGTRYKDDPIFVRVSLDGLYVDHRLATPKVEPDGRTVRALFDEISRRRAARGSIQEARGEQPHSPAPIAVVIEGDVPASKFVPVVSMLSTTNPTLAFAAPPIDAAYAVPKRVREANSHLYEARPGLLSSGPEWPNHDCTPLHELGARFQKIRPAKRWPILESEFGKVWVQCGCDAEFDLPRYLATVTATYERQPLATQGPQVAEGGTVLDVPPTQTWETTVVDLRAGPVWLKLR